LGREARNSRFGDGERSKEFQIWGEQQGIPDLGRAARNSKFGERSKEFQITLGVSWCKL
jgi:hypothetical protein